MDINRFETTKDCEDGADLVVIDKHGEKTDFIITLAGPDSDRYRRASRRRTDKRLARIQRKGREKMSSSEMEEEDIGILADCTISWKNPPKIGGKAPECNTENARDLYLRLPLVMEQVDEFVGDRANFTKN